MTKISLGSCRTAILLLVGCSCLHAYFSPNDTQARPSVASASATSSTSPYVQLVRRGILNGYKATTIGKALEGTFQNPTWKFFETAKGIAVVEFNGSVPAESLMDAGAAGPELTLSVLAKAKQQENVFEENCKKAATKDAVDYRSTELAVERRLDELKATEWPDFEKWKDEFGKANGEMRDIQNKRAAQQKQIDSSFRQCLASKPPMTLEQFIVNAKFQFILDADRTTFRVGAIEIDEKPTYSVDRLMNFVYR